MSRSDTQFMIPEEKPPQQVLVMNSNGLFPSMGVQ